MIVIEWWYRQVLLEKRTPLIRSHESRTDFPNVLQWLPRQHQSILWDNSRSGIFCSQHNILHELSAIIWPYMKNENVCLKNTFVDCDSIQNVVPFNSIMFTLITVSHVKQWYIYWMNSGKARWSLIILPGHGELNMPQWYNWCKHWHIILLIVDHTCGTMDFCNSIQLAKLLP